MAKKYNVSITQGTHTFTVEGCDSFDEALKLVIKGIYDFNLANPPAGTRSGIMGGNDLIPDTSSGPKVVI
jgi:hypothetical protein